MHVISDRPAVVSSPPPDLTIVVPVLNERNNIESVISALSVALSGVLWEVIFVDDDSRDDSAKLIRALAQQDTRVRCLQRIGRRGLSTACIEGVLASASPYVAIMDGDLQHDERLLPRMLDALRSESIDVVIGSRYVSGGGIGMGLSAGRARGSRVATFLSSFICRVQIADPMSGFFMFRREIFDQAVHNMSAQGFKILLDLLASSPQPLRIKELPFVFRERQHGESKLDLLVVWEYGMLLADKMFGDVIPVRFALFAFVGALGLIVHMATLWFGLTIIRVGFSNAQAMATIVAMTSNFFLNNVFTYRDQRLRGWKFARGLVSFYLICGVGAAANVGIATYAFRAEQSWWLAGLAGILVGSVWNYAVSSFFTWKAR